MDFLKKNIWVTILAGFAVSFIAPALGTLVSPFINPLFMVLMFFSTLDIKIKDVLRDIRRPGKTIVTLLIIHTLAPLIVVFMKPFLSPEVFLGFILATTTSSGVSVVFLTKLYQGEPSRSLVVTTVSNLLAPISIPLLVLFFAGANVDVSFYDMSKTIIKLIIIPFVAAQFVAHTKWQKPLVKQSTNVLLIVLMFIIIGIVSPARNYILNNLLLSLQLAGIAVVLNIVDFLAGFSIGKKTSSKISYGISSSFKNFVLSTVLAITLFGTVVALPSIVYGIVNSFLLIPVQWFLEGYRESHPDPQSSKSSKRSQSQKSSTTSKKKKTSSRTRTQSKKK